ncbi:MAG: YihY/virulence factor BrkB family protein [Firmicutes bacterium]|nr:YihY/virulence factor BrkB family protein [Bacillota bacterium]
MKKFKTFINNIYEMITRPEMKILPGQLAYFLVLSVIPITVLIGFICSIINISLDGFINAINNVLPVGIAEILVPFINGEGLNITVGISMIVGFILASNGPHSIIITSNTLYGIKHSSYLSRHIKAFLLTILIVNLFIFTMIVLAFGNHIVHFIFDARIFETISPYIYQGFVYLKWPIGLLIVFVTVKLIYTIAPDARIPSKYNTTGSILTTVLWSIVTIIYSYYVSNFNNYDVIYGSLANIAILMLWVYILSYILVLGMAINVHEYEISEDYNKIS